jgi:V/A-type H+-transporting ATPase subunit I
MFAPKQMREINLFVAEQDVTAVTRTIARLGMLHLLDVSYLGEKLPLEHADRRELIRSYAALKRRFQALVESIAPDQAPRSEPAKAVEARSIDQLTDRARHIEAEIQPITGRLATVEEEVEYLAPLIDQLALLSPLDIDIEDLQTLDYLYLAAGSLPTANLDRLETSLFHLPHVILPFQEAEEHVAILVFASQDRSEVLERALNSAYFAPFDLPVEFSGPLDEVLEQIRQQAAGFEKERKELHARLAGLWEKWGKDLLALSERAWIERILAESMEHFGRTGHIYLIAGWIPAKTLDGFLRHMDEVTEGRVVSEVNRPQSLQRAERTIPSALNNPSLLRPFEQILAIYGQPSYHELDPTPLVAITFLVMFGMMFGDVGHGLLLAATGGLIVSGLVPQLRGWAGYAPILLGCGLSSALFGVLYGSVFGVEDIVPALWLSPLHNMLSLLIASVAFGVVVLNIGFLFNVINAWRARNWQNLLFGANGLAGFLLYWAILVAVLTFAHVVGLGLLPLMVVAAVAILAMILGEPLANLLAGERPILTSGLFSYLIQVFFELFETVIAFLSNTLSYVRLGAFAVAHIGLTSIVFILADLAYGVAPLRWLVIVLGTLIVVAFEGLIVGIQTLRLEYYEFFNKFFHGVGIPYQPLDLPEA